MQHSRRTFFYLAGGLGAVSTVSIALAERYPTRPVRIIVGFPPGGPSSILARLIGQSLSARLGQQFVIENRPGAGTNIATEAVVRAAADGYTLLLVTSTNAVNATLYDQLNFNFIHDITPVAGILREPLVMMTNPAFPAASVPEFIAYAKGHPGNINMASSGIGSPSHVAGELFSFMAGIHMVHVPYKGDAPAITSLLGGQVQVMFGLIISSIEQIRAGRLRALAVTSATRLDVLPDTPTVAEFLRGYEASAWQGIGAPRDTPTEIVDQLNKEVNAAVADPKIKVRLADLGGVPMPMTPSEFGRFIVAETNKWAKVIKFAGVKPDELGRVFAEQTGQGVGAMPFYEKAAVRIYFEEAGSGYPLLVIPGGGLNSTVARLDASRSPFNPMEEFGAEYRCIASDLRNAHSGRSTGPLEIDRPWDAYADDQIGVMDHLGIDKFVVLGFCIGGPFIWNLLKRAPDRIVAAVIAQPSGSQAFAASMLSNATITKRFGGVPDNETTLSLRARKWPPAAAMSGPVF